MRVNKRAMIGKQTFEAERQPKRGDREDFIVHVVGPDPSNDFKVPVSITGTILAIWGRGDDIDIAEELTEAIFNVIGTASQPPEEGFWFDSYNSEDTVKATVNKIANEGSKPFTKNAPSALFVRSLGQDLNSKIQELDTKFTQIYGIPFFNSLEDLAEESQIVDDLNTPSKTNAEFLYRVCIISSIIDHIKVSLHINHNHVCNICNTTHSQMTGSIQELREWVKSKNIQGTDDAIITFQMVKKLRKQYPIHDYYETANNVRRVRKGIEEANQFFGIVKDFESTLLT